jgi:hypothetical protein
MRYITFRALVRRTSGMKIDFASTILQDGEPSVLGT